MYLDPLQCLQALELSDIRVARSDYVDSAEGAIAFATRRTARDERLVPILLRIVSAGPLRYDPAHFSPALAGVDPIRRAYDALAQRLDHNAGEHVLAQEASEHGTDVAVDGHSDERSRRIVRLRSGEHGAERTLPLDEQAAAQLVRDFQPYHHRLGEAHTRHMLEHVVLRIARFFVEFDLDGFAIDPLRLHENGYTVLAATATASHALHLKERLDRHAHDRKEYGFRPSGPQ